MKSLNRLALVCSILGLALATWAVLPSAKIMLTPVPASDRGSGNHFRKAAFQATGDPEKDRAAWAAINAQFGREREAIQAAHAVAQEARRQVWNGTSLSPGRHVAKVSLPAHEWVCDNFGDPSAPKARREQFQEIGNNPRYRIVGWSGVTQKVFEQKEGREVQILVGPRLMSPSAVTFTNAEWLETWFMGNDGSRKFIKGELPNGRGFWFVTGD